MHHRLLTVDNNGKKISYNGYAFIDIFGRCIVIAYGEDKRDNINKYLNEY
jgi:hypothetical protein